MVFMQFKLLVVSYDIHFVAYYFDKKKKSQLIPNVVQKSIYQDYLKAYHEPHLPKKPWGIVNGRFLKVFKMGNSNAKGLEWVTV
jgi:hypothetical protein